jgi:chromosome segregation ATPase
LGTATTKANEELTPLTPSQESGGVATQTRQEASPIDDVQEVRQGEDTRQARIAAAKVSLQDAQRSLTEARGGAQRLEAAQEKAYAEANQAEKELRELEERLKKASVASRNAAERSQSIAAEAKEAAKAVEDAERNVGRTSKELESLLRQSDARKQNNPGDRGARTRRPGS